jgi:hypothetical protein
MVKKIDKSNNKNNVKVKQKQNVNVRVHIDQRDLKKKTKTKKRSNIPSAKREGVSSFSSSSYTPVYIQSSNPYPIAPIPPVPDATPIKVPVYQREVSSLVNPPITSTTNLVQEVKNNRSISPLSYDEKSSSDMYPNVTRRNKNNNDTSGIFTFTSNPLRADETPNVSKFPLNSEIMERSKEMKENKQMGKEDKKIPSITHSASPSRYSIFPLNKDIMERSKEINENIFMGNEDKKPLSKIRNNISLINDIMERSGEIREMRNMGNEDVNVNVKKVPRVRRTREEIARDRINKEIIKKDKNISKNERDLMKQEDTRRKEQLKKEKNERNRMGKNDINVFNIRGL